MLRSITSLLGNRVIAEVGFAGEVTGFDINVSDWHVSALTVKVGRRFRSRTVRIPSISLRRPVGNTDMLPVGLRRKQIEESPTANADPMSAKALQEELLDAGIPVVESTEPQLMKWHLIVGFRAMALDGQAGTPSDLIIDTEQWTARYVVVTLFFAEADHQTLIPTVWVCGVHEKSAAVSINLSLSEIAGSPGYDPRVPVNRDSEGKLYDYYGQPFRHQ